MNPEEDYTHANLVRFTETARRERKNAQASEDHSLDLTFKPTHTVTGVATSNGTEKSKSVAERKSSNNYQAPGAGAGSRKGKGKGRDNRDRDWGKGDWGKGKGKGRYDDYDRFDDRRRRSRGGDLGSMMDRAFGKRGYDDDWDRDYKRQRY